MLTFRRSASLDRETMQKRNASVTNTDFRLMRNLGNRYQQVREEMNGLTYSGMGGIFPVHDGYATESQGPIQDRTQEHLTSTDKAVVAARKLLLNAVKDVQEGREAPHVIRDPEMNHFSNIVVISKVVSSSVSAKDYVRQRQDIKP